MFNEKVGDPGKSILAGDVEGVRSSLFLIFGSALLFSSKKTLSVCPLDVALRRSFVKASE